MSGEWGHWYVCEGCRQTWYHIVWVDERLGTVTNHLLQMAIY